MVLGTDFNQFSSLGVMKNLDELIERDAAFEPDRYFSSAFCTGQYGGVQYALPYETVPTLMFVNKTLLTKEGIAMPDQDWTWELGAKGPLHPIRQWPSPFQAYGPIDERNQDMLVGRSHLLTYTIGSLSFLR